MAESPIPEGSIVITPAEVYGEVKVLTDQVRTLLALDKAENLPERMRKVETKQNDFVTKASARWWFGAVVALIGAASTIVAILLQ